MTPKIRIRVSEDGFCSGYCDLSFGYLEDMVCVKDWNDRDSCPIKPGKRCPGDGVYELKKVKP
jgi:hypothetical protein